MPHGKGQTLGDVSTAKERRQHLEPAEAWGRLPQREQPCPPLGLELLASRTGREEISVS